MKNILLLALVFLAGTIASYAQLDSKEIEKMASEESEALLKEGWKVNVGSMPLKYQLIKVYTTMGELQNGQNKYIISDGKVIGATFEAARVHAMEIAKRNMITLIENMTLTETEGNSINSEERDIESGNLSETKYKNTSSLELGNLIPLLTCYRQLPNGNIEVLVNLACLRDNVIKAKLKKTKSTAVPKNNDPQVTSSHTL